jgi:hypothetical protein
MIRKMKNRWMENQGKGLKVFWQGFSGVLFEN